MENHGYRDLAKFYDRIYSCKDYEGEADFLESLFNREGVETFLDVGCGTGTHMELLEERGFEGEGLDLNREMLRVAREKVKGRVFQGDMRNFDASRGYDSVICMFAGFNHLTDPEEAREAISCFKDHLKRGGVLLIDLHNPPRSGSKKDSVGDVVREIEWNYDPDTGIEESSMIFNIGGEEIRDHHTMRIYTIDQMLGMVGETGFDGARVYEDYSFRSATPLSKNLEVFAWID